MKTEMVASSKDCSIRPTREMVMRTRAMIARADKDIQEIIKENDVFVREINKRNKKSLKYQDDHWPDTFYTIGWMKKNIKLPIK